MMGQHGGDGATPFGFGDCTWHVLEWCEKKLELWQTGLVLLTLVRPKVKGR